MRCPFCHTQDTKVIDSRLAHDGDQVRRRRECLRCIARFTTYEVVEMLLPRLIKNDGRVVAFQEQKLRSGILRALEKRSFAMAQIDSMVKRIMDQLCANNEREVPTKVVGELVMNELKSLDRVAYVRFASVYRCFEDIQEFAQAIENLCDN